NFIIGTYFFIRYTQEKQRNHWVISLIFITLAVLARTSFLFLFLSILLVEFIRIIRTKQNLGFYFLTVLSALSILGIYYGYNYHLRTTFGTLFLNHLAYPADLNQFMNVFNKTLLLW